MLLFFSHGVVGHAVQTNKRMEYNPQDVEKCDDFVRRKRVKDPHGLQRENGIVKGFKQSQTNYPTSVLKYRSVHNPSHPTQKPVALMAYLIKTYTNVGDMVLDFCIGSGTTLVAAKESGRKAIGIELSERDCEIAARRLQQEVMFGV
jgi:site-specific DNA-methyltransferase (adenine-specific)